MGKRLLWIAPGWVAGMVLVLLWRYLFGNRYTIVVDQLPLLLGVASLWLAERKGKAPTMEEVERPISLFDERLVPKEFGK